MKYLQENIDITNLSNFKTKAKTKYYFEINNEADILKLKEIFNFASKNKLKTIFVWAWTNMLFAFDFFNWIVIKNNLKWYTYNTKNKILEVYTWEKIWDIAEILENKYNQNIWHRFIWLPWSIWWALLWNAWCFWLEAESNFISSEVYNIKTWEIEIIDKKNAWFDYRNSIFKKTWNYLIIKAFFDLSQIIEKYPSDIDNIKFREELQPKWNSCWSFFKNPSREISAWKLIEEIWLKWYTHNTAYFSDIHANFLMTNVDNWDYRDLIYLIDLLTKKVKEKYDIILENEVRIIKN